MSLSAPASAGFLVRWTTAVLSFLNCDKATIGRVISIITHDTYIPPQAQLKNIISGSDPFRKFDTPISFRATNKAPQEPQAELDCLALPIPLVNCKTVVRTQASQSNNPPKSTVTMILDIDAALERKDNDCISFAFEQVLKRWESPACAFSSNALPLLDEVCELASEIRLGSLRDRVERRLNRIREATALLEVHREHVQSPIKLKYFTPGILDLIHAGNKCLSKALSISLDAALVALNKKVIAGDVAVTDELVRIGNYVRSLKQSELFADDVTYLSSSIGIMVDKIIGFFEISPHLMSRKQSVTLLTLISEFIGKDDKLMFQQRVYQIGKHIVAPYIAMPPASLDGHFEKMAKLYLEFKKGHGLNRREISGRATIAIDSLLTFCEHSKEILDSEQSQYLEGWIREMVSERMRNNYLWRLQSLAAPIAVEVGDLEFFPSPTAPAIGVLRGDSGVQQQGQYQIGPDGTMLKPAPFTQGRGGNVIPFPAQQAAS